MRASAWAPSALIFTCLTAVLGRDVLSRLGSAIANDAGDPLLTAAILGWNARHVPYSDAWWQFPIFHPTRDALAFSEHLLGVSVMASPLAWITGDALVAYNLTTLLTFPLSAMAMFALVYYLTRHVAAAFLAGLAFGFAPYRMSILPHIQMLTSFWAPLALVGLHAYLDTRRRRWLVLYGGAWSLQALANGYMLVFFSVLVGLWVAWFVVARRDWAALGAIALVTLIATLPLAPIVYKYVAVHAVHGFERSLGEVRAYSADIAAVLCAPSSLSAWGWMRVGCRAEGELFPGVAAAAIFAAALHYTLRRTPGLRAPAPSAAGRAVSITRGVLLAVTATFAAIAASILTFGPWQLDLGVVRISARQIDKPFLVMLAAGVGALLLSLGSRATRSRSPLAFYLFAAVVTWTLALGPTLTFMGELTGRPGPFLLLHGLPGAGGLRVPARFWSMTSLCAAAAIGVYAAALFDRRGTRFVAGATAVLGAALLADGWRTPVAAQPLPAPVPGAASLRGTTVLHLPVAVYPDIAATWQAVSGGWRAVNGYSGYVPNYYEALRLASALGDEGMFAPFRRLDELYVVVENSQPALRDMVERATGAVMLDRNAERTLYRLPRHERERRDVAFARLPVVSVASDCASDDVSLSADRDEQTHWECLNDPHSRALTVDLGVGRGVGAVEYSLGRYFWNVPTQLAIDTSTDGVVWTTALAAPAP